MMDVSLPINIYPVFRKLFKNAFWQQIFHLLEKELVLFAGPQIDGKAISRMNRGKTIMLCCNTVLALFSSDESLEQWVEVQYCLEEIDRRRAKEGWQANLEHALSFCQQALLVYTREEFLIVNGIIQILLGVIYVELGAVMNKPEEMYERALICYLRTESIFAEETFPLQWAIIQQALSFTYTMRIEESKDANLQQAITRGQSSLRVFTRTAYPLEWACTHTYLAEAYRQAATCVNLCEIYSGRSSMQEQAHRHLEAALQIYTVEGYPVEWAKVQHFLGMIYLNRVRGRRRDNLEQARDSFESALHVFQQKFFPSDYAAIHELLGSISLAIEEA